MSVGLLCFRLGARYRAQADLHAVELEPRFGFYFARAMFDRLFDMEELVESLAKNQFILFNAQS
jgi:hypothetical protein